MRFSDREIKDLVLAWALVSIAFAIAIWQTSSLITNIWVSGLTVGVAFIVHELAHKFTAQHYRKFAEFKANLPMLIFMLILSFTGLVLAAPGAVIISGFVSKKENGIIAAAGPLSNIALAIIFLILFYLMPVTGVISLLLGFGFLINTWLALFNMIPFGIFDGAKVIAWDKKVYFATVTVGILLLFFGQFVRAF